MQTHRLAGEGYSQAKPPTDSAGVSSRPRIASACYHRHAPVAAFVPSMSRMLVNLGRFNASSHAQTAHARLAYHTNHIVPLLEVDKLCH